MAKIDFEVFRGDTFKKTLKFTDGDGNPIDISGWKVTFTVKRPEYIAGDDDDSDAEKQIVNVVTDGLSGKTTLDWQAIDIEPGNYVYDIQVVKADGTVFTPLYGAFNVNADVTREV